MSNANHTTTTVIYWDEQDPANPVWAYRTDDETGNGGSESGAIDGSAARALTDLVQHGILSDAQILDLEWLVDRVIGVPRESVTLEDVGPLWP